MAEKFTGGGTPLTSNKSFWEGEIPWIQSSDLIDGELVTVTPKKFISATALNGSATRLIQKNSIAIVTRVGVGKLAFMPYPYATSQDFLSLSNLHVEPEFAIFALYKKLQSELNNVQGTSIKGITKKELLDKRIMLPCSKEQKAIGAFLSNLNVYITLHQREQLFSGVISQLRTS